MDCSPPGSSIHGDSLGKNTGVGCHALPLQGNFPTQGSNPGFPHCKWIHYHLSHQGSPRVLEWADYLFCMGPSQPRNQTGVSWIAGRFFSSWDTREANHGGLNVNQNYQRLKKKTTTNMLRQALQIMQIVLSKGSMRFILIKRAKANLLFWIMKDLRNHRTLA